MSFYQFSNSWLFKVEYCSFVVYWGSGPLRGHSLVTCEKSVSNPKSGKFSMLCPQALKRKPIRSIKTHSEFSHSKQGVQMRTVGKISEPRQSFLQTSLAAPQKHTHLPLPFDHAESLTWLFGLLDYVSFLPLPVITEWP